MARLLGLIGMGLCFFIGGTVTAATWYVDDSVSQSGDGHSWETAFRSVQEGIDAASEGDTVLVAEGTYFENILFRGAVPQEKTIFEEKFDSYSNLYTNQDVTDAGWEVKSGCGDPNGAWRLWSVTGEPLRNQAPNLAGMTGNYMITDSDMVPDVSVNEELITPQIDCAGWAKVRLEFSKNYRVYTEDRSDLQVAEVDIRSFDEGSGWGEWVNLLRYDSQTVVEYDTTPEQVDISEYADGRRVQIRWHFYLAEYDWWFAIDEVAISGEPANLVVSGDSPAQPTEAENIILQSKDPFDPAVVAETVLDGGGAGCVASFSGAEDETCVLAGFTIRNGNAEYGGGIWGGRDDRTHATIRNNIVRGNKAGYGGGVAYCDGVVENNIVCGNSARVEGGGLFACDGTIQNNTIYGNAAGTEGGGMMLCNDTIRNCILWGNTAPLQGAQLLNSALPTYSCIQNWQGTGEGNMTGYPYFVLPEAEDYYLQSWSPCIDAGDPSSDYSREPQPNGGTVNMGAYGNTPQAASACEDTDGDLLPDDWEIHFLGDLNEDAGGDADGDGVTNLDEYRYGSNPASVRKWYVDGSVADSGDGTSRETAFRTIQEGIDAAAEGEVVVVAEGIYAENIVFRGPNIALISEDPLDATVAARTILDGGGAGSVVSFTGTEGEACLLAGFTIRNGNAADGGGICGRTMNNITHATIRNNVITGNSATSGGGMAFCDGVIENNVLTGNSADRGGGLYWCGGNLGGPFGTIRNNIITDNQAATKGGGLNEGMAVIENCRICRNTATDGGGLSGCQGTIENCEVCYNSAGGDGGGLHRWMGGIRNSTICRNNAGSEGGGLYRCLSSRETPTNCIIWGNVAPSGAQLYSSYDPKYSCIQDWTKGGEGNIAEDPCFRDADHGDFRLTSASPCLDAGNNGAVDAGGTDVNGSRRIMYGGTSLTVDMGACEYYINTIEVEERDVILTWSSLAGVTYSVCRSDDMKTWEVAAGNVLSMGETVTVWIDPKAAVPSSGVRCRFYKVRESE